MITMFKIGNVIYENEREINRFDPKLQASWTTLEKRKESRHDDFADSRQRQRRQSFDYDELESSDSNTVTSEDENQGNDDYLPINSNFNVSFESEKANNVLLSNKLADHS